MDFSVVANAKDLPHTVVSEIDKNSTDKNMLWTKGINQVLPFQIDTDNVLTNVPDEHFVSYNLPYNKANLENFYEGLVTKFPNHPPIEFNELKDNEKLLLSYFFYNIRLPNGFRVSASSVDFHGTQVKSLQYRPQGRSDSSLTTFYKNDTTHEYAFKIIINGGKEELVMYSAANESFWKDTYKNATSFISGLSHKYKPAKDESVLVPEIDFSIVKDYSFDERKNLPELHDYSLAEERIKLKISAPATGGPMEVNHKYDTPKNYALNGNLLVYIKEVKSAEPYCIINVKHPEILKVEHHK